MPSVHFKDCDHPSLGNLRTTKRKPSGIYFLNHLISFSECVNLILFWLLLVRQYWVKPEKKMMMKYCQEKTMRSVNNGHKVILRLETYLIFCLYL